MAKPSTKPGLFEADSRDQTKKSRSPKKTNVKNAPDDGEIKLKISDVLDAFPFYVMLVDRDHHIILANKAVSRDLGSDPKKIIGQYCPKTIHGLDGPFPGCPLEEAASRSQSVQAEMFDSGKGQWFKSGAYLIRKPKRGHKAIFLHTIQIITEEKLAKEELQRNYAAEIVLNQLLQMSLEDIPLKETLQRALDLLISIPWLSLESKGCIFLVKDQAEVLVMAVQKRLDDSLLRSCAQIPFGKCICGMAASNKKVVFINQVDESHEIRYEGIVSHGHYCIPIMLKGKILGVINTYIKHGHEYSDTEERFLINVSNILSGIIVRKRAEESLRISQNQLRELARHLESIREEERTSLAREIHDELGQLLTGLKMDASWISKRIPPSEEFLVGKAKAMGEMIDGAIETVKRVSVQLRPAVLDYLGLAAAIDWQTKELEKHSEISFEFKSNLRGSYLDRDFSTAIFRICQEALTNVVRHADATRVKVTLREERRGIALKIKDNGKGIDAEHVSDPKSFGLFSMQERARHWGGQVKIKGTPGKGTLVLLRMPLANQGES
jgi:signal transduction histidine kinase